VAKKCFKSVPYAIMQISAVWSMTHMFYSWASLHPLKGMNYNIPDIEFKKWDAA
jgi:hypothetical protein